MSRARQWLRATVDDKPWWAIILVAFLASLGSESVKRVPELIAWVWSTFPIEPTVYIYLRGKGPAPPIDGAKVSIMDPQSGNLLIILNVNETSVRTRGGYAFAKVRVKPRLGYALVLSYVDGGREFQTTFPIELRGDIQQQLEFDPDKWTLAGTQVDPQEPTSIVEGQADLPPWMKFAYGERGVTEAPGPDNNPRILEYFRSTRAPITPEDDQTNWSSAFIHWVLGQAGIAGTRSLSDRSWLTWGKPSELKPGCIAVLWRIAPTSEEAHSGFFVGQREDGNLVVLGGNQSDQVRLAVFPRSRLLGCRWPP
jgi:uncharacterized protein (TIGR02594 family)